MDTLPKNAPHAYAHARPWDKFRGKQVGKKEVSAQKVFRPGHKENASIEHAQTSSGAYGAFLNGPARAPAVEVSRRQFGAFGSTDEPQSGGLKMLAMSDVLGDVNLASERRGPLRKSKLDEPPPDTLRWNPATEQGNANVARRRLVHKLVEQEAELTQPPQRAPADARSHESAETRAARASSRKDVVAVEDPLRGGLIAGRSNPRAQKHEDRERVRHLIAEEKNYMPPPPGAASGMIGLHGGMSKEQRAAALMDPRVQAALNEKLNAPNNVAAEQFRVRNTSQVSAERKY